MELGLFIKQNSPFALTAATARDTVSAACIKSDRHAARSAALSEVRIHHNRCRVQAEDGINESPLRLASAQRR
ncbi:MAG: hypothetical protein ACREH8_03200 [Opitutaceae bacterium]